MHALDAADRIHRTGNVRQSSILLAVPMCSLMPDSVVGKGRGMHFFRLIRTQLRGKVLKTGTTPQ
jgi:hypothetical protein